MKISNRKIETIKKMYSNHRNEDIAKLLKISSHTVKKYGNTIFHIKKNSIVMIKYNYEKYGSRTINAEGYAQITAGDLGERKQMLEHRYIMEKYLNRKLERFEHIHHINGNKSDNRLKNLELTTRKFHPYKHHKIKDNEYKNITDMYKNGLSMRKISKLYKVTHHTISRIINK